MGSLLLLVVTDASADGQPWSVPLYDGPTGATCAYFNAGARLPWRNAVADWLDATGNPQGKKPFASNAVADVDQERAVEWDLTSLVKQYVGGPRETVGLVLRDVRGGAGGKAAFHSREAENSSHRPVLVVDFQSGESRTFGAAADTYLDCTTTRSLGTRPAISAAANVPALIAFDLGGIRTSDVRRAVLRLTTTSRQYGATSIGVFRLHSPEVGTRHGAVLGIAARYPADRGLAGAPEVVAFVDHESSAWQKAWSQVRGTVEVVDPQTTPGVTVWQGRALQVTIPKGQVLGANLRYVFRERVAGEPEEMYIRYYLHFADNWDSRIEGGKLPGLAGTYNTGGWGGRKANGTNGWSMRGFFQKQPEPENPLSGYVSVGTYAYHADMATTYGDYWMWSRDALGVLERNRWYCIEQHVRLNDVGRSNGVLRAWVDGELAFEKSDIRSRTVDTLKIEDFWFNVYHGGTKPVRSDQQLYVDNIVIARKYIGPMVR